MYANSEYSSYLQELSTSPKHLKLLESTLGRLFKYETARGDDWRMVCTDVQARQVSDWLSASLRLDADWLNSVDSFKRVHKLVKMKTIDQMTNEARKFMIKNAHKLEGEPTAQKSHDNLNQKDYGSMMKMAV